ncbi:MAG TPA: hypothetical protein VKB75_04210 [Jatrophihabitans sp.]|nr:hypothetical protein [Jatrophihabitans sp.]
MRMMATISFPVEAGNKAIEDGSLPKIIEQAAERWKPEAMFFTAVDGKRTAIVVFDMVDSSAIPEFAEPFFMRLNAQVQFAPVMNAEDLQKGLSALG